VRQKREGGRRDLKISSEIERNLLAVIGQDVVVFNKIIVFMR
jgi:hypothetical protein